MCAHLTSLYRLPQCVCLTSLWVSYLSVCDVFLCLWHTSLGVLYCIIVVFLIVWVLPHSVGLTTICVSDLIVCVLPQCTYTSRYNTSNVVRLSQIGKAQTMTEDTQSEARHTQSGKTQNEVDHTQWGRTHTEVRHTQWIQIPTTRHTHNEVIHTQWGKAHNLR